MYERELNVLMTLVLASNLFIVLRVVVIPAIQWINWKLIIISSTHLICVRTKGDRTVIIKRVVEKYRKKQFVKVEEGVESSKSRIQCSMIRFFFIFFQFIQRYIYKSKWENRDDARKVLFVAGFRVTSISASFYEFENNMIF